MGNVGCVVKTNFVRAKKELVESFRGIPVSNLDDCMNRTAAINCKIRPVNKSCLLGTAFTVKVAEGDNLFLHKAMDLAEPGDVIIIDAGGYDNRAIFGEIMATYCKTRGINGIVIDGAIRDYDAISRMEDFAVYAKGISPNGPYKNGPGEIGTVISIGGVIVHPGDIVLGDGDGVVIVSPEDAGNLAKKALVVIEEEKKIFETMLKDGKYIRLWVDDKLAEIKCEYLS